MPTCFSLTLDSTYGSLVLVAGESIIDDITEVRIKKAADGGFDCEMTRGGGHPVKLLAAASPAGRQAVARATGQISSSVPGFVEMSPPTSTTVSSLTEDVAACLGWRKPA